MKASQTENNFIAYLLLLGALFILIFFTRDIFSDMQFAMDERDKNAGIITSKKEELDNLNKLNSDLSAEESIAISEIQWFIGEFSSDNILEYLHKYAWQVNSGTERIILRDISINGEQISDLGFKKASIDVSATISSEDTLFSFLSFLTDSESDYRFYITSFEYPMDDSISNIQVDIPLTLYYK